MKLLNLLVISLLGLFVEQAYSQPVTNWGVPAYGVQLSIALSNNVIDVGSAIFISTTILNSSTNIINMIEESEIRDFDVMLINSSGKEYRLTPDTSRWPHTMRLRIMINPGESREWKIPVTVGKDIQLGSYTLKASTKHVGFELVSNSLKVQIK